MAQPETDKQRRQRQLDQLAFEILAARHTEWTRWTDWFELVKAKQNDCGLGNTTFSDCVRRLLSQGKARQSQIAKNRFYQAVFAPGSWVGADLSKNGRPSSVALDVAAQALEQLSRKSSGVV
jgi:hypothetical protein